jgi:hypothetical protein
VSFDEQEEEEDMSSPDLDKARARQELRRSNAAVPHRNRKREEKRPGKGSRNNWKKEV